MERTSLKVVRLLWTLTTHVIVPLAVLLVICAAIWALAHRRLTGLERRLEGPQVSQDGRFP